MIRLQNSRTGSYRINMKLQIIFVQGLTQLFIKNTADPVIHGEQLVWLFDKKMIRLSTAKTEIISTCLTYKISPVTCQHKNDFLIKIENNYLNKLLEVKVLWKINKYDTATTLNQLMSCHPWSPKIVSFNHAAKRVLASVQLLLTRPPCSPNN